MPVSDILRNRQPASGNWCIACNPILDIYHGPIQVSDLQTTDTFFPILVTGATPEDVCNKLFSTYDLDPEKEGRNVRLVRYTPHTAEISTNYPDEASADANVACKLREWNGVIQKPIKHPGREEYAVYWFQHIHDNYGNMTPDRSEVETDRIAKVLAGHTETMAGAAVGGWR